MINKQEEYSMPEILDFINEAFTRNQKETNDLLLDLKKELKQDINILRQEVNNLKDEVHEGFAYHETWFNRIEKNMATKTQLNSLLGILQRKDIISKYEISHIQTEPVI